MSNEMKNDEEPQTEVELEGVVEAEENVAGQSQEQPQAEALLKSLEEAQARLEEQNNQVLRMQAEMENTRRRAERDVQGAHKFALEKFVNELLPVKDSLELGEAASRAENADLGKVREGMELTLKMLADTMARFGVVEINPVGQPFSPDLHQAMSMQDVPDASPNTVVTVFQKGYLLNERLVRPAMVVVASANSGTAPGDQPPSESSIDEMA